MAKTTYKVPIEAAEMDPADWLPPAVVDKLERLRNSYTVARGGYLGAEKRSLRADRVLDEETVRLQDLERRKDPPTKRYSYVDPPSGFDHQPETRTSPELIERQRTRVARAKAEQDNARRLLASAGKVSQTALAVLEMADGYVRSLEPGLTIELSAPAMPAERPADPQSVVAEIRAEVLSLRDDLQSVRSAPIPKEVAKDKATRQLEALRQRGCIDVFGVIDGVEPLKFPQMDVVMGGVGSVEAFVQSRGRVVDTAALIAWLYFDDVHEAVMHEIDERADDSLALSDDERAARVADLEAEILLKERQEESVIDQAELTGTVIMRRREIDPRALLCLADTMPIH